MGCVGGWVRRCVGWIRQESLKRTYICNISSDRLSSRLKAGDRRVVEGGGRRLKVGDSRQEGGGGLPDRPP